MNRVFVDTSAFLALLVRTDRFHAEAAERFERLRAERRGLVTTSYVLVETYAVLLRRCGLEAVSEFRRDFASGLDVVWVDPELHERGLDVVVERGRRDLSLVDAVSFAAMRDAGLDLVFAFDRHFQEEGFTEVGGRPPTK